MQPSHSCVGQWIHFSEAPLKVIPYKQISHDWLMNETIWHDLHENYKLAIASYFHNVSYSAYSYLPTVSHYYRQLSSVLLLHKNLESGLKFVASQISYCLHSSRTFTYVTMTIGTRSDHDAAKIICMAIWFDETFMQEMHGVRHAVSCVSRVSKSQVGNLVLSEQDFFSPPFDCKMWPHARIYVS